MPSIRYRAWDFRDTRHTQIEVRGVHRNRLRFPLIHNLHQNVPPLSKLRSIDTRLEYRQCFDALLLRDSPGVHRAETNLEHDGRGFIVATPSLHETRSSRRPRNHILASPHCTALPAEASPALSRHHPHMFFSSRRGRTCIYCLLAENSQPKPQYEAAQRDRTYAASLSPILPPALLLPTMTVAMTAMSDDDYNRKVRRQGIMKNLEGQHVDTIHRGPPPPPPNLYAIGRFSMN